MRCIPLLVMVVALVTASTVIPAAAASSTAHDVRPTHASATGGQYSSGTDVTTQDGLRLTDYEVQDRRLGPDEPLRMTATLRGEGEEPAATDLTMTIDGDRHRIAHVTADPSGERVAVEAVQYPGVEIHCEFGYDEEDGYYIRCEIDVSATAVTEGDHEVGLGDLEPTTVTAYKDVDGDGYGDEDPGEAHNGSDTGDDLRATDYVVAVEDGTLTMVGTYEGSPTGDGTPVTVTVDGQRHDLGSVVSENDSATFVPNAQQGSPIDVEIYCEYVDGEWRCTIIISFSLAAVGDADGDHRVALNDLEPRRVTAGNGNASSDVEVDSDLHAPPLVAVSDDGNATLVGIDEVGSAGDRTPVTLTVDRRHHDLGSVVVSDNHSANFVPNEGRPLPVEVRLDCWFEDGVLHCVFIVDFAMPTDGDEPGEHRVALNDLEPTTTADNGRYVRFRQLTGAGESATDGDDAIVAPGPCIPGGPGPTIPGGPGPTFPGGPPTPCPFPVPF